MDKKLNIILESLTTDQLLLTMRIVSDELIKRRKYI